MNHIQKLLSDIKNIINKLVASGKYDEIKAWQNDVASLEKLNNMFLDVLDELAAKNADNTAEIKNTAEAVMSKNRNPVQSQFENDVDAVINGTYNGDAALIMGVTPQIYQKLGFSKLPIAITPNHVYSIAVTAQQAKKDNRYRKNINYHGLGAETVKDIYKHISDPIMVIASSDFQNKSQRDSAHKVIAIVDLQVNGKQVIAPIEIDAEVTNGKDRIDVNLVSSYFDKDNLNKILGEANALESSGDVGFYFVDKKRAKNIFKQSKVQYLSRLDSLNSNGIIHKIDNKVNRKIDTVLKSQQFVRWFGDWQNNPEKASKIVNPDGTPKVMYHGTQSSFTVFDKKKAKSYGYYGKGFYFTDSESHAGQYGNSMAVYLDVKNPLEQGKNHISKKQLRKFLEAVAENEDYDIWNYGTEDISEIIDSIYRDDAFAVLQDVNATAIGDLAEAITLFNKVNNTNYDGVITPTETVVYEPTQIKSATDNIGTFDKSNPDIRYSRNRDTDYMTAVENGDMETAQRMVDEAAKNAGYTVKGYHGTGSDFTVFDESKVGGRNVWGKGFYFGSNKGIADDYAQWRERKGGKSRIISAYLKFDNPFIPTESSLGTAEEILDKWFPDMWRSSRELGIGYIQGKLDGSVVDLLQFIAEHNKTEVRDVLSDYGYDGIIDGGEIVAFKASQIKSADPITYDDNGNVIPLSERFDENQEDIRYSRKRLTNQSSTNYTISRNSPLSSTDRAKPNPRSSINWVYQAGLFSVVESKLFHQKISEINQGSQAFRKDADGNYMLPIENKIVFTDGNYDAPEIIKIVEFMSDSETNISNARRLIYRAEKGESSYEETRQILEDLFGYGFVYQYNIGDDKAYEWANERSEGRNRRTVIANYYRMQNRESNFAEDENLQDITPSTKRELSISEEASDYILDTKEYQEILDIVDQRFEATGRKELSPKAIDRLAGKLLTKSKSNYSREQLTERLTALFDFIANSRDVTWEEVTEIAANIAKDMLSESQMLDRSMLK